MSRPSSKAQRVQSCWGKRCKNFYKMAETIFFSQFRNSLNIFMPKALRTNLSEAHTESNWSSWSGRAWCCAAFPLMYVSMCPSCPHLDSRSSSPEISLSRNCQPSNTHQLQACLLWYSQTSMRDKAEITQPILRVTWDRIQLSKGKRLVN